MRQRSKTGILPQVGEQGDVSQAATPWRDRTMAGGGLLLLGVSFRPWWGRRIDFGGGAHEWHASASLWSLAVVLGLLAVGLWFSSGLTRKWRRHGRELAAACLLVATGVSLWQVYRAGEPLDCSKGCGYSATLTLSSAGEAAEEALIRAAGGIERDRLFARSGTSLSAGLRSGFYMGVAVLTAMALVVVSVLVHPGGRTVARPPGRTA